MGEGRIHTVERRVHPANIDQQAHHGHIQRSRPLGQQLILENLAALATLGHSIQVDIRKRVAVRAVARLVEDLLVVLEDVLEEVILDVLAPQRDAVILLEVPDLVAGVDGRDGAVGVAAGGRWVGGVEGLVGARGRMLWCCCGGGWCGCVPGRGARCARHWGLVDGSSQV